MRTSAQNLLSAVLVLWCTVSTFAGETLGNELNTEVNTLYQRGLYTEATTVAEKALKVAENTFGPYHPGVARSLSNLALPYYSQGRCGEAEPLFKQALGQ